MTVAIGPIDFSFDAPIGVMVKGDLWSCVEVPGPVELFGTGKSIRTLGVVDGRELPLSLMPTGSGGHMFSVSAKLRKTLGKGVGDTVSVRLTQRVT